MSFLGWFDGEIRPDGWFDAEIQPAGWFDTEVINTSAGGGKVDYALTCAVGAYSIAGQAATLTYAPGKVDYTLSCAAGSYAIAGQAATLKRSRTLSLATGAYTLSGVAATLKRGYSLSLAVGAYSIAGQAATFKRTYSLVCATGAYSVAGQTATLKVSRLLALDAGAYALAGGAATLDYVPGAVAVDYALACDAGAYSIVGQDAALDYVSATAGQNPSGGIWFYRRKKTKKEIEEKRRQFGVIPDEVAQVVTVVAQKAIAEATKVQATDVLEWVTERQDSYQQAIETGVEQVSQVANGSLIWDEAYRMLLAIAVEDELEREEELVINMLMHEL